MRFVVRNRQIRYIYENIKIGDNADYVAAFELDDEWTGHTVTARFINGDKMIERVLDGNSCSIPVEILKKGKLRVGVYTDEMTTTPCELWITESIKQYGGTTPAPSDDVYAQILGKVDRCEEVANDLEQKAESGYFNGKDGIDGKDGKDGKDGIDGKEYDDTEIREDISDINNNLSKEVSDRKSADALLKSRVDALASLQEGSTTGDAELLDIRVKADGTTATSAGNAVREQVSELKGDLYEYSQIMDKVLKFGIDVYWNSMSYMQSDTTIDKNKIYYNSDTTSSTLNKLRYFNGSSWILTNYLYTDIIYNIEQELTLKNNSVKISSVDDRISNIIKTFPKKNLYVENGLPKTITDIVPSSIPISISQNVHFCGKNIFPCRDAKGTAFGVSYAISDGIVKLNGTATQDTFIGVDCNYYIPSGTTYAMSCNYPKTTVEMTFDNRQITDGLTRIVTVSGNRQCNSSNCGIKITNGKTYNNLEIEFQIELGNEVTQFSKYTEYAEEVSSIVSDTNSNYSVEYYSRFDTGNVKDYGAKGDGVSDDTLAIQNAFNTCRNVYIPKGEYIINGTINIPSNTHIYGDGFESKIKLGNDYNLTRYEWRESLGSQTYYFYPYLITEENADSVSIERVFIEGNTTEGDVDQIQTGFCFWKCTNGKAENVRIEKVNWHPESAPPRETVHQTWRRGWCLSMFYSENIAVRDSIFKYGPYECLRIGDFSKHIMVDNCTVKYGWRTGLQLLKGTEHVTIQNCDIEQDSQEESENPYCTGAVITFHSYEDGPIKHVKIINCNLHGVIWNSGGSHDTYTIHFVDSYNYDILFDGCTVNVPNSFMSMLYWGEKITVKNCEFISDNFGCYAWSARHGYSEIESEVPYAEFVNNKIFTNGMGIILINYEKVKIVNNDITGGLNTAVYNPEVETSPSLIFMRATAGKNPFDHSAISDNILHLLSNRNGLKIEENTIFQNGIISNNIIYGARYPISGISVRNSSLIGNVCTENLYGIDVPIANNVIISNVVEQTTN